MSSCPTLGNGAPELPDGPDLPAAEITFRWLARPYAFLDECAAAFGDTFTLHFTRFGTHVLVAHPDDVRAVFTAEPQSLRAGRGNAPLEPVLGARSLLLVDGERHAAQRTVLQPAFRPERIQAYARVVADATRRRTRSWTDGAVAVQRTALDISREVVLRAVCGIPADDVDRLSGLVRDLMALVETNATFEADTTDARLLERFRSARAALGDALLDHVDRRRRNGTGADDVLAMLVDARPALPDDEVRDQLITMILAGHETTAAAITWALLCLAETPAALRTVCRELDAAPLADEELPSLPFLQAVCLETLRLRPVIPVVSRELVRPLRLGSRLLPPGLFVTPCAYLAHRRPGSFPEPDAFRPERFAGRRFSPYVYFPFGGGARRCIGMGFALLEMQIVLGMLLRGFEFAAAEGPPVRPVRRAVTIVPSGEGRMQVERRRAAR